MFCQAPVPLQLPLKMLSTVREAPVTFDEYSVYRGKVSISITCLSASSRCSPQSERPCDFFFWTLSVPRKSFYANCMFTKSYKMLSMIKKASTFYEYSGYLQVNLYQLQVQQHLPWYRTRVWMVPLYMTERLSFPHLHFLILWLPLTLQERPIFKRNISLMFPTVPWPASL